MASLDKVTRAAAAYAVTREDGTCKRHHSAGMQSKLTSSPAFHPEESWNEINVLAVSRL